MSLDAYQWAWSQRLKPTQKLLLLALADRAGEDNTCFPSIQRLELDTCLNRKTIILNIQKLAVIGLLEVEKTKTKSGQFKRNIYTLMGVKNRENNIENPRPKNGTRPCPTNGQNHVPKTDKTMSQKRDTNLSTNLSTNLPVNLIKHKEIFTPPNWLNLNAWKEYEQHRKEIKKPLTNLSRSKAATELFGLSEKEQQQTIDKTIQNRWTGLFPERKNNEKNQQCNSHKSNHARVAEKLQAEIRATR